MSIPPFVSSTPPPPDQCDDDKEHEEEYGIQYNLSQDEDDNYDYGNFSSYNHYETETTVKNPETPKKDNSTEKYNDNLEETKNIDINNFEKSLHNSGPFNECNDIGTNVVIANKLKCDEDVNIEDLNLILDEESICTNIEENEGQDGAIGSNETGRSTKNIEIPSISDEIQDNSNDCSSDIGDDVVISSKVINNTDEELDTYIVEEPSNNLDINKVDHIVVQDRELAKESFVGIEISSDPSLGTKDMGDDDFSDLDDFQFVSSDINNATIVDNCENPWGNNATSFGDFTANFDENYDVATNPVTIENEELPNIIDHKIIHETNDDDDDDDFGDFDDFKSSISNTVEESIKYDVPVLNLHSVENEQQILENINKVLCSVFEEEIIKPETEFEGNLESFLSETWGHLLEIDVRQPYIVNWNNSLGQKTLLKALCIDSRNILFGPKWGYNMPKYAANLTTAPLQPQKQVASTSYHSETTSSDKSDAKPSNWGDPFKSDGQKSCNANETATTESGPVDVFDASLSTKSDKIYSSTLNVQPLRQINLPDTHIFTPTDSETPRSKTIHYDSGLPVLLPQPVQENSKKQPEHFTADTISNTEIQNKDIDGEDWDFQDFKSNTNNTEDSKVQDKSSETSKEIGTPSNVLPQAVQILQPIKLEPIIPTLNWPDPGEVSEVFDDFSDFVSNSSWNDKKHDPPAPEAENKISESVNATDIKIECEKSKDSRKVEASNSNNSFFDDEFDRFQSAIPTYDINKGNIIPTQNMPSTQIADFGYGFPKNDFKSDTISFSNETKIHKTLSQNTVNVPSATDIANKSSSGLHSKLLQPIATGSNVTAAQNQQSGQILQPLSLESYSQINWPSPGIDLQDLSRFNPVETLQSLKTDLAVSNHVKMASPIHNQNNYVNQTLDDDVWGDFVSSKPNKQQQALPKKQPTYVDDDEWTEFVSSPSVKPQNGLNTISLNVHTNLKLQKSSNQSKISMKNNQVPIEIPTLNYITPKMGHQQNNEPCNERHFQNL